MSLRDSIYYHFSVDLAGPLVLRWARWQAEHGGRKQSWKSEYLAPPLKLSARNKELVGQHYLRGRFANLKRKVAWVTSGAPSELLKALDFYVFYPENHGAVCGTMRRAEDLCSQAENAGYSRDLCSYFRTDIGAILSSGSPIGRLPKPDLLMACTNICQTVLGWYRVLSQHFQVPLILIDTPFLYYPRASSYAVEYVKRQLEDCVPLAEKIAGKALSEKKARMIAQQSRTACELWMQVLECAQAHPSPLSVFDEFTHMAPIVELRGEVSTVDYYAAMLKELRERISHGVGAVKNEKKRLLWDNLPIWFRLRSLAELLGEHGAALIASTYTNAWAELAELIDPEAPFDSMARTYLHAILNQGAGHKFAIMKSMAERYQLDGAILHSDRSCKPYSIGQMDERDQFMQELHLPALLLEADHNDPRAFSEGQARNRIEAFLEMLG